MAFIALAADKGAPGVTTLAVALGAVWPRNVLVAECDPAGGDLVYRLPAGDGGTLNPARGLLSLAATARRGLQPEQLWQHSQKLVGGLDVLVGLTSGEQAGGLGWLWSSLGQTFATLRGADVIADCGRLGGPSQIDALLAEAAMVVLVTRPILEHVAHMRERMVTLSKTLGERLGTAPPLGVAVIADPRQFHPAINEIDRIVKNTGIRAGVLGGLALDPKGAQMLRGEWAGKLDRSLLIRSARELAGSLAGQVASLTGADYMPPPVYPGEAHRRGDALIHHPVQAGSPEPRPPQRPLPAARPGYPMQDQPSHPEAVRDR